jgi:hypothetical protein
MKCTPMSVGCGRSERRWEHCYENWARSQFHRRPILFLPVQQTPKVCTGRLLAQGISVRYFGARPALQDYLRITCPGNAADYQRLEEALRSALGSAERAAKPTSELPQRTSLVPEREANIIKDNALLRGAELTRVTKETQIAVRLVLDGDRP